MRPLRRQSTARGLAPFLVMLITLSAAAQTPASGQRTFTTPDDAVVALLNALRTDSADELLAIFGPDAKDIASGDTVADRNGRRVVARALEERWSLADLGTDARELVIGNEDWPFPITLVRESGMWRFDTAAGREELLARRIGRNELAAIRVCRTYVVAQREYAAESHDHKPAGCYAQKVSSEPGMHDGLYWATRPGEKPSPLGALAAEAADEGYGAGPKKKELRPLRGYLYRILFAQGPDAPGGERAYVVNGAMTGGFALVAYPTVYGNSGIMTFMVSHDGVVYERDLGEETARRASEIKTFNPDKGWSRVADGPEALPGSGTPGPRPRS